MFTVYSQAHHKYYSPFPDGKTAENWAINHLPHRSWYAVAKTADIPLVTYVDFRRKAKIPTCWQCGIFLKPAEQQREECLQCFADEDGCHDTYNSEDEANEGYPN